MFKINLSNSFYLIIICLFFSFLSTSSIAIISYIGYCFMGIVYILASLNLLVKLKKRLSVKWYIVTYGIVLILVLFTLNSPSISYSFSTVVQLLCIFLLVRYTQTINISCINKKVLSGLNCCLLIIFYFIVFVRIFAKIDIMFHNISSIGPLALCMTAINYCFWKGLPNYKAINFIGYIPLFIICKGRTSLICLLLFIIYCTIGGSKDHKHSTLIFIILFLVVYLITAQYPLLYRTPLGTKINEVSLKYTGKAFFSGRQSIWRKIFKLMEGHELLGYGTGVLYSQLSNDVRSAHNQYLQLYLQDGIIGLVLLGIVLYIIWKKICFNKNKYEHNSLTHSIILVSEAFFIVFVFYNIFSVGMLQNSMATANFMWFIVSLGLNENFKLLKRKV